MWERPASTRLGRSVFRLPMTILTTAIACGSLRAAAPPSPFSVEIRPAMERMHMAMESASTGDSDRDFARSMIAHHQGGIDMALAELRLGRNERLRRLAQEIIVEQRDEIEALRLAAGEIPPSGKGRSLR